MKSCVGAGPFEDVGPEGFNRAGRAGWLHAVGGRLARRPGEDQRGEQVGIPAGQVHRERIIYPLEKHVVNPIVLLAWDAGLPPPGDALLETTGRRTGQPRRTPVCDGLDGDTFWLVAQRGHGADWVRNIAANPPVRVKFRSGSGIGWRAGTAHILDEDDPHERQRLLAQANLARRWCVRASAAMGTSPLTVRIDLDPR